MCAMRIHKRLNPMGMGPAWLIEVSRGCCTKCQKDGSEIGSLSIKPGAKAKYAYAIATGWGERMGGRGLQGNGNPVYIKDLTNLAILQHSGIWVRIRCSLGDCQFTSPVSMATLSQLGLGLAVRSSSGARKWSA
jgi:hypothetical protein